MRRSDREVKDFDRILEIIDQCRILRLGLADGYFPYIVPLNFSYRIFRGDIEIYFHGAMAGKKYELLKKNPYCSFEMDIDYGLRLDSERKSATNAYASVMGKAKVEFLEGERKKWIIDNVFMQRNPETRDFEYNKAVLSRTAVGKLKVLEISAKENPC